MDEQQRDDLLRRPLTAVLATVDPLGRPHAVPVWFLFRDGSLEIFTDRESAKVRNIRATGRAALAVDEGPPSFRHVTVEGPVDIQERVTREERLRLHVHYRGEEAGRRAVGGDEHERMVILRVRPERWY